jgi:hypothetical protein
MPNLGILKVANLVKQENPNAKFNSGQFEKWARFEFRGKSYSHFKFGLRIRVSGEVKEGWGGWF